MLLPSPIIPLITSSPRPLSRFLGEKGFLVRPITYPTVPKGQERVRVCLHAGNTEDEVRRLSEVVSEWVRDEGKREAAGMKAKGMEAKL
jgi:8-amino-7-oxononanoate synthase